ncbi:GGDEF domain-containing protein [Curvivirga aplysinae]|uniref:GGDEF domain-containing protein n=1 Tax=Curvivirga aplysinae TaxID=2529852 RepID=UPI0012BCE5F5|nr:GGDEF domain-containing protein [Curvivirga aplysinae]MTI09751.1 GGDEF domain-containing protein [Curvivirga aplysinae]
MSYKLFGDLFRLAPYLALVILAAWLGQQEAFVVDSQFAATLPVLPYVLCFVGCLFAWNFKMSTSVLGFLVIGMVYWTSAMFLPYGNTADVFGDVLFAGLSILLPVNLVWLCWAEERGVLSRQGLIRLAIISAQFAFLLLFTYVIEGGLQQAVIAILNLQMISGFWTAWSNLPQLAIGAYIVSLGFMLLRFMLQRSPLQMGWISTLVASYFAFQEAGNPDQVALYISVALLALIIAKVQVSYQMAFVDELTSIPGRRALMSDMKKLGSKYVIAMSDIDHFKKFNDTYGHDIGDEVLRMVANRLSMVTGGGRAYRYGGEEFCILMPVGEVDKAIPHLEKLREVVEHSEFVIRSKNRPKKDKKGSKKRGASETNQSVQVTISIGVAAKGKMHADPMAVMKSADEALYRAKKKGRNQVAK